MLYRVIKNFNERFDRHHTYEEGDTYPVDGFVPPEGRAEALATGEVSKLNKIGAIFLEAIHEPTPAPEPKPEPAPEPALTPEPSAPESPPIPEPAPAREPAKRGK